MTTPKTLLLLALGGAALLGGCRQPSAKDASAKDASPDVVASYSYSDGVYAETVTLRPNGRYLQTLAEKKHPAEPPSLTGEQISLLPYPIKITGQWLLLAGPGGAPIPLPASASALPKSAVVLLKSALPFGITYEGRSPLFHPTDRTLSASEFTLKKT